MWCFPEEKNMWIKGQWYQFTFYLLRSKVTDIYIHCILFTFIYSLLIDKHLKSWSHYDELFVISVSIKRIFLRKFYPINYNLERFTVQNKKAFQFDAYRPLFWLGGDSLKRPPQTMTSCTETHLDRDSLPGRSMWPGREIILEWIREKAARQDATSYRDPLWADRHLWKHYLAPNFVCRW